MSKSNDKTNVMRTLDRLKLPYKSYHYLTSGAMSGIEVATTLNQNPAMVFKTLVTESNSKKHYVFLVPVAQELDLKKAAKSVGEKKIEMVKSKDLLSLTGYIHGGCSPIGMKKQFQTVIDERAKQNDTIIFSGGKIGYQVEISLLDLNKALNYSFADLVVES